MVDRSRYSSDAENPGNNLYVTGLSTRVREKDLEKHFSSEGKVCMDGKPHILHLLHNVAFLTWLISCQIGQL